ncbi:hypothetical protein ACIQXQ_18460 [Peribacillus sp. NPDC097198]|uniref:hypothetical protein n=1 Tax=Peribacillus sp. NPDC097198 TaxID=3364397 RepID=UPI00380B0D27
MEQTLLPLTIQEETTTLNNKLPYDKQQTAGSLDIQDIEPAGSSRHSVESLGDKVFFEYFKLWWVDVALTAPK